jgi:Membrane transport protein.
VLGTILWWSGITGMTHRVILLQMAMPPAFATLVIAEAYELDQELSVTALATGSVGLLVLLPFWFWLFGG